MSMLAYTAILFLVFGAGCGDPPVANRHSTGKTVICFGDSLTEGVGASLGADYPSLLGRALGREVINAGSAGEVTADGLKRIERDVLSQNPKLVIVQFGGNDFMRGVPKKETFANLEEMVRRIQEAGAMVVLVGVQPGLIGDFTRSDYQRIARRRRAVFVPNILEGIITDPSLKSDTIHPNDAGYEKIAKRLLKAVRPLLEE